MVSGLLQDPLVGGTIFASPHAGLGDAIVLTMLQVTSSYRQVQA